MESESKEQLSVVVDGVDDSGHRPHDTHAHTSTDSSTDSQLPPIHRSKAAGRNRRSVIDMSGYASYAASVKTDTTGSVKHLSQAELARLEAERRESSTPINKILAPSQSAQHAVSQHRNSVPILEPLLNAHRLNQPLDKDGRATVVINGQHHTHTETDSDDHGSSEASLPAQSDARRRRKLTQAQARRALAGLDRKLLLAQQKVREQSEELKEQLQERIEDDQSVSENGSDSNQLPMPTSPRAVRRIRFALQPHSPRGQLRAALIHSDSDSGSESTNDDKSSLPADLDAMTSDSLPSTSSISSRIQSEMYQPMLTSIDLTHHSLRQRLNRRSEEPHKRHSDGSAPLLTAIDTSDETWDLRGANQRFRQDELYNNDDSDSDTDSDDDDDIEALLAGDDSDNEFDEFDPSLTQEERIALVVSRMEKQAGKYDAGALEGEAVELSSGMVRGRAGLKKLRTLIRVRNSILNGNGPIEFSLADLLNGTMTKTNDRKQPLIDRSPIPLSTGDTIEREAVLLSHSAAVTHIHKALNTVHRTDSHEIITMISLQSLSDANIMPSLTVFHGRDQMIVEKWLQSLAKQFIVQVQKQEFVEETKSDASTTNDHGNGKAVKRVSALDRLGLDRRTLYQVGLTHERIDQIYSAIFAHSQGFYELLTGLVTNVAKDRLGFMLKAWKSYVRVIELSSPALYQWSIDCVKRLNHYEAALTWQQHLAEVKALQDTIDQRREESLGIKLEQLSMSEALEDSLDLASETRVSLMTLQRENWRAEQEAAEITDEMMHNANVKAIEAEKSLEAAYQSGARIRETRSNTVKAIKQCRIDVQLALMAMDDMQRTFADQTTAKDKLLEEFTPIFERVTRIESQAATLLAASLAALYHSHTLQAANTELQTINDRQLDSLTAMFDSGLTFRCDDDCATLLLDDLAIGTNTATNYLIGYGYKSDEQLKFPGLDRSFTQAQLVTIVNNIQSLTQQQIIAELSDELWENMLPHQLERDSRVVAAKESIETKSEERTVLQSAIKELTLALNQIKRDYRVVYDEHKSMVDANINLQSDIDDCHNQLAIILPKQSETQANTIRAETEIAEMLHQCEIIPLEIQSLAERNIAAIPRQAELDSVEKTKGEILSSLQSERDKLDIDYNRSQRNFEELKAEIKELELLSRQLEASAEPLYRDLDGKFQILEKELEFKLRDRENCWMKQAETDTEMWEVHQQVREAQSRLNDVSATLATTEADTGIVRAVYDAEREVHDGIRAEMRIVREAMQAKNAEKEEFLAVHAKQNNGMLELKQRALTKLSQLKDQFDHCRNELRSAASVNEQMALGFEKRIEQWNTQILSRRQQLNKKIEADEQRKHIQKKKTQTFREGKEQLLMKQCEEQTLKESMEQELRLLEQTLEGIEADNRDLTDEFAALSNYHDELERSAPIIQAQLDRVLQADQEWSIPKLNTLINSELAVQAQLMQAVSKREEQHWNEMRRRRERFFQTEPHPLFPSLQHHEGKVFTVGKELGFVTTPREPVVEILFNTHATNKLRARTRGSTLSIGTGSVLASSDSMLASPSLSTRPSIAYQNLITQPLESQQSRHQSLPHSPTDSVGSSVSSRPSTSSRSSISISAKSRSGSLSMQPRLSLVVQAAQQQAFVRDRARSASVVRPNSSASAHHTPQRRHSVADVRQHGRSSSETIAEIFHPKKETPVTRYRPLPVTLPNIDTESNEQSDDDSSSESDDDSEDNDDDTYGPHASAMPPVRSSAILTGFPHIDSPSSVLYTLRRTGGSQSPSSAPVHISDWNAASVADHFGISHSFSAVVDEAVTRERLITRPSLSRGVLGIETRNMLRASSRSRASSAGPSPMMASRSLSGMRNSPTISTTRSLRLGSSSSRPASPSQAVRVETDSGELHVEGQKPKSAAWTKRHGIIGLHASNSAASVSLAERTAAQSKEIFDRLMQHADEQHGYLAAWAPENNTSVSSMESPREKQHRAHQRGAIFSLVPRIKTTIDTREETEDDISEGGEDDQSPVNETSKVSTITTRAVTANHGKHLALLLPDQPSYQFPRQLEKDASVTGRSAASPRPVAGEAVKPITLPLSPRMRPPQEPVAPLSPLHAAWTSGYATTGMSHHFACQTISNQLKQNARVVASDSKPSSTRVRQAVAEEDANRPGVVPDFVKRSLRRKFAAQAAPR